MATVLLSAAGAAVGGSIGGSLAGLSSVAIGRLVGATLGKAVDQRLMGQGADVVESGRVDRFRLTNAAEGEAIAQLYGRMRVGGQVIWATKFREDSNMRGGVGKGRQPAAREYSYSVSLAIALCEGEITHVSRVWADGVEIAPKNLNMRVYKGAMDQLPDPKMEAVEGVGKVPAYRGTAYVVLEDLPLAQFGNRVPQFTFEVSRPMQSETAGFHKDPTQAVQAVAMIPGSGEYALATSEVFYEGDVGESWSANANTPLGVTDAAASIEALGQELPNCNAVSLVVSWFGDDLRVGSCALRPKVEQKDYDGGNMPWVVSGVDRDGALAVPQVSDRPVYGGTPTDQSVVEAIQALQGSGKEVMFYPFILMDQITGNGLDNPYNPEEEQPNLPWRGRMTLSLAPGQPGSPDRSAQADAEVAAFFGTVTAADFQVTNGAVTYTGPEEWSYRRFVLHNAALCAAAGGVHAFAIGSELRGVTQIRGAGDAFVAVAQLRQIAGEVRALLGADVKIGYAADWTEYFGYHPQDGSGDVYFHLDPLWADENIDFIGIDNYMPLSDWREGESHIDAEAWGDIYNVDYLKSNIEGGEGYDWYYHSIDARNAQIRSPITDGAHEEHWVYRYKDIKGWWAHAHHNRVNGVRAATPTAWVPQSKPIWFTELGCAAIDKGTNEPNKFLDAKSSESSLPRYSNGARDDLLPAQYLRAMYEYWGDADNNPISVEYDAPMLDMSRAFVWAWDARPYPFFPNYQSLWSDGENYARGHWLNGRSSTRTLAHLVAEICDRAGVLRYDTSRLWGIVRGYAVQDVTTGRAVLQPLMLRYGFDAVERDGVLHFVMRSGRNAIDLDPAEFAVSSDVEGISEQSRASEAEMTGRVRLRFVQADGDYDTLSEEAILPDEDTHAVSSSEIPLALTRAEGRQTVERWLSETRIARDSLRFALPPSMMHVGAGDVVKLPQDETEGHALYRIDRMEQGMLQVAEATRIESDVYRPAPVEDEAAVMKAFVPPVPVLPLFMDLPLLRGDETPHAPHLAITAKPWPGSVALYDAATDEGYVLKDLITQRATIGRLETPLHAAQTGLWDLGDAVMVKLSAGQLTRISEEALLSGGNLAAIGDGNSGNWEIIQFQEAELVAQNTYLLRKRLRGVAGSDGVQPQTWPSGSWFVLLDAAVAQIDLPANTRNIARHYRVGPAKRDYEDASFVHKVEAFEGVGLKPYAPCHLRARAMGGDLGLSWVRRSRIDGDSWDLPDVPLGEESEQYRLRVFVNGAVVREEILAAPERVYTSAEQVADGVSGQTVRVDVAQISARFGAGAVASLELAV